MITVRDATEHDLPQILAIYNEIILHTTAVYYYEPHTLEMRREWFESRKRQGFPVFVAEEDGVDFRTEFLARSGRQRPINIP